MQVWSVSFANIEGAEFMIYRYMGLLQLAMRGEMKYFGSTAVERLYCSSVFYSQGC